MWRSSKMMPPQQQQQQREKKWMDEPAVTITAQTTLPLLTTVMLTLSVILVAIVGLQPEQPSIQFLNITIKNWTIVLLLGAALSFAISTEKCTKSQAWDYFSISEERRNFELLEDTEEYKSHCLRKVKVHYKFAAITYS